MKINSVKLKTILLSLFVMALWGSLYPLAKIGYKVFSINGADVPSILMFAGTRFTVCGIVICAIALFKKQPLESPKMKSIGMILAIGLFSSVLHYAFTYVGLSLTESSKAALIKQLASLLYVCFGFLFFKSETFSPWKIVGAIVGFLGIVAINFSTDGISFSNGDILIVLASFCDVTGNVLSKKIISRNSPFWVTGISQLTGGLVLMLIPIVMGADMLSFDLRALGVFACICTASTVAYLVWTYILRTSELSNMLIIKFAEPLFACIFGAILLGENIFKWQYAIAFLLICSGIIIGNKIKGKRNEEKNCKNI